MKKFKQFIKDKNLSKEDEDIPLIPMPIHFKHVIGDDDVPLVPTPIHFKHVSDESDLKKRIIGKIKKKLYEAVSAATNHVKNWLKQNDNAKIGKTSAGVSKKLRDDAKKIHVDHIDSITAYTKNSSELNDHLIQKKSKPTNSYHKIQSNNLDAAIDSNRSKRNHNLYSGVGFDPHKLAGKKGKIKSHAYISASSNKAIAKQFAESNTPDGIHHIIHFKIKKGDPSMHIAHHSGHEHEHESIIKRGTTLVHHGYKDYTEKYSTGRTIVTRVHSMSIES